MKKGDEWRTILPKDLEEDIYSEEGTQSLLENDEISAEEAAFMIGWEAAL